MTKHTPGPWRRHDMEDDAVVAPIDGLTRGGEVANVGNSCFQENRRADVCLIAAAPELLDALKQQTAALIAGGYDPDSKAIAEARAAIAKATT